MANGADFPDEDLPGQFFSGQQRVVEDASEYPGLATLLNRTRQVASARIGTDTIPNGAALKAVTFATAFPAGTTVRVVAVLPRADIGAANSLWVDTVSETGFTVHTTGAVGADIDFDYIAVPA